MPRMWDLDDLASPLEIAITLDVSKATISNWRKRYADFPEPLLELPAGPLYSWKQVRDWYNERKAS